MATPPELQKWLDANHDEFGDKVPNPQKAESLLGIIRQATGVNPHKYLGAGDNGIAFLTDKGTVLKLTIDNREALLWGRLKGHGMPGMIPSYGNYQLVDQKTGPTIVFVAHVGYAPKPLDAKLQQLLTQAVTDAEQLTQDKMRTYHAKHKELPKPETRYRMRTMSYLSALEDASEHDNRLDTISNALMDLADKYDTHLFDITPQNFGIDAKGNVVLLDPSLPDMGGEPTPPEKLMFEERVAMALYIDKLLF